MGLFDNPLRQLRNFLQQRGESEELRVFRNCFTSDWPGGQGRDFVLKQDMAVELGSPRNDAVSFLVWDKNDTCVSDGDISVTGPDLKECSGKSIPFGMVILLGIKGAGHEDDYALFRELEDVKYRLDLKGYMRRGVSQFQREWSRISTEAIRNGFTFKTLGTALIDLFHTMDYVTAAEVIVTSSKSDVKELKVIAANVLRIIEAMNKMINEELMDCDSCAYADICNETTELKAIRDRKLSPDQ